VQNLSSCNTKFCDVYFVCHLSFSWNKTFVRHPFSNFLTTKIIKSNRDLVTSMRTLSRRNRLERPKVTERRTSTKKHAVSVHGICSGDPFSRWFRGQQWPLLSVMSVIFVMPIRDLYFVLIDICYCYLDRYGWLFLINGRENVCMFASGSEYTSEKYCASEDFDRINCKKNRPVRKSPSNFWVIYTVNNLLGSFSPKPLHFVQAREPTSRSK